MKRIVLYNIFISTGISLIYIIYWLFISDVSKYHTKVFDYIGVTLLCILTLLWNGLLLGTLVHSPRLNEPQTYLIVLIFLANVLRSVLLVVLYCGQGHVCPYKWNTTWYKNYTIRTIVNTDNQLQVPYITILTLNSIISWTLLIIGISRFYLSFRDERNICKKVKCMVVLLIVVPCSIIKACFDKEGLNFNLISICLTGLPYVVVFFLLIAYSARVQYDYPTEMNYLVLWFFFLLFGSVHCPLDVFLTGCLQDDYFNSLHIFVKTNLLSGIIMPQILLLIDKNLRRGLFDYFPNTPRITELLSDNNEQRHLIGTIVEDEKLGAQRGGFPSDDPKSSAQTIENVFPEDSELKAPCKEFGPEDTEYKAPQQYEEDYGQ